MVVFWIGPALGNGLLVLYWDVVYQLSLDWYRDPDYSHGFLIPFFIAVFSMGKMG